MTTAARVPPGLKRGDVTIEWLSDVGACEGHVELFVETFGDSVDITPESIARAAAAGLDLDWAAAELLDDTAWAAYQEADAWDAYQQAKAWDAYQQAAAKALIQILFPDHGSDT